MTPLVTITPRTFIGTARIPPSTSMTPAAWHRMYLTPAQVGATLKVVAQRSAKHSRLCVVYHSPALILWLVNFVVRRLGEPLRSSFTVNEMRDLLANNGFAVERDEDAHTIGVQLSGDIAMATKYMRHTRIATALRQA